MIIVIQGADFQIFEHWDGLYYWRGIEGNSAIDSPKGWRTIDEAFEAAIDTIQDFENCDFYDN